MLHPDLIDETDYPTREAGSCAPFVSDEASVQPLWQRLADRAAAIGRARAQSTTTTDASLHLQSLPRGRRLTTTSSSGMIRLPWSQRTSGFGIFDTPTPRSRVNPFMPPL